MRKCIIMKDCKIKDFMTRRAGKAHKRQVRFCFSYRFLLRMTHALMELFYNMQLRFRCEVKGYER